MPCSEQARTSPLANNVVTNKATMESAKRDPPTATTILTAVLDKFNCKKEAN
jgi:hypothetical protein